MDIKNISERFNQGAESYDARRRLLIPCFDDFYNTGISLLAAINDSFDSILDLGAGTGLLTQYLYSRYPDAQITLVDVSDKMLEVARRRFAGLNNFNYIISDYSEQLPPGQFSLIASALSIHHLENDSKKNLYTGVYSKLEDGGCFINFDQFNASSDLINRHYEELWFKYVSKSIYKDEDRDLWFQRRELDRENTIDQTILLLKQAGFRTVECVYSYMKFGVVIALK